MKNLVEKVQKDKLSKWWNEIYIKIYINNNITEESNDEFSYNNENDKDTYISLKYIVLDLC